MEDDSCNNSREEVWKKVPDVARLEVSSEGRVRTQRKGGALSAPYVPNQDKNSGYRYVCGRRLANLMLTIFVRPPKAGETADHIRKYDGDWRRERGDDRLVNLRWATGSEQKKNQVKHKAKRNGRPIWLRHVEWTSTTPSMWFPSGTAAAKAFNLSSGAVSDCAHRKRGKKRHRGWEVTADEPLESQNDLTEGDQVERWTLAAKNLYVSSFGRAQWKNNLGDGWGWRFTPQITAGEPYAKLGDECAHVVIYTAFHGPLDSSLSVDHDDQDKSNNRLDNLKAATRTEQNLNRTVSGSGWIRQSLPLRGRPVGSTEDAWQHFPSQNEAARILTTSQNQLFHQSNIGKVISGHLQATNGWEFQCLST